MSKEILSESFIEKLVDLLVKSAVTKKKPKALVSALAKDPSLNKAFSDIASATDYIRKWADEKRKDPEWAAMEKRMTDQMR